MEIAFYPGLTDLTSASKDKSAPWHYPVTATYRPPDSIVGRRADGEFAYDPDRLLRAGDANLREYGMALGEGLFQGAIFSLFRDALSATRAEDSLHVMLSLEAPSLRVLNWERLCGPVDDRPDGWDFLGLSQRTPLAVYVAGATDRRFPPIGFSAFRTLLVIASPTGADDAPPFDVSAATVAHLRGLVETPDHASDRCVVLARNRERLVVRRWPGYWSTLRRQVHRMAPGLPRHLRSWR
jgi:hypothetical protein